MPDPITAVIGGGALLGAGSSIYSANKASSAQKSATASASAAQKQSLQQQWEMYQQQRKDYAPWRKAGQRALTRLERDIRRGPGEFIPEEQPGYQFGFREFIQDPFLSSQSAVGKRLSGETIKGLTKYAGDYAETAYQNFLNRYYQSLTPNQSLAGVGMTAAGNQAQAAQGFGNAAGQYGTNMANLQYQNALNQGSYQTQMAAGIAGAGQNALNNYINYKMGAFGNRGGGGYFPPDFSGPGTVSDPWSIDM